MSEIGVALIGGGSHQFTPEEVSDCGARVRFATENPADFAATAEWADAVVASDVQLASIMLFPVATRVIVARLLLERGCHVILERPAALSLADLSTIEVAAGIGGVKFWERATTSFEQPYLRLGQLLNSGALGDPVLLSFHRSYPWAEWRNSDESEAGGLVLQTASYGLDLVCSLAKLQVARIHISETRLGEPLGRPLRMAATVSAELVGGALAYICVDYLNPTDSPWAREEIRILGSSGRLELDSTDGSLKLIKSGETVTERPEKAHSQLLSEVISAIREGRDTQPSAVDIVLPTRVLLAARETTPSNWSTYTKAGWS